MVCVVGQPTIGMPHRDRVNQPAGLAQHRDLAKPSPAGAIPRDMEQHLNRRGELTVQRGPVETTGRAQRLEPALAFWVDLLRQLGLLGTVLGIGLSLAYTGSDLTKLLGPLALKVWTTVAGLACSIVLSSAFAMKLTAWVDAAEKNLEAWDARRKERR